MYGMGDVIHDLEKERDDLIRMMNELLDNLDWSDAVDRVKQEFYQKFPKVKEPSVRRVVIVKPCGVYRDGGTEEYRDDENARYFIDKRMGTKTPGKVYNKYPGDEGATILNVELVTKI